MKCLVVGCVLDLAVLCGMTRVEWYVVLLCLVVVICECLLCSLCADNDRSDVPLIIECLACRCWERSWNEMVCECSLGFVKSGGVVGISSC